MAVTAGNNIGVILQKDHNAIGQTLMLFITGMHMKSS